MVEDGDGSSLLLSKVANSLLDSCGEWCKGVKVAVLLGWCMGSSTGGRGLQRELAGLLAMAGAFECVEAMWVVRRWRGLRQKAGEVAVVAGVGGRSQ